MGATPQNFTTETFSKFSGDFVVMQKETLLRTQNSVGSRLINILITYY